MLAGLTFLRRQRRENFGAKIIKMDEKNEMEKKIPLRLSNLNSGSLSNEVPFPLLPFDRQPLTFRYKIPQQGAFDQEINELISSMVKETQKNNGFF